MDEVPRLAPGATTLLDLLWELQGAAPTSDEQDLVEIALELVANRRVRLTGTYRDTFPAAFAATAKPAA